MSKGESVDLGAQGDQSRDTSSIGELGTSGSDGFHAHLIEQAIMGDGDALNQLWIQTRRWVAVILLAHKPKEADIEDLLQVVAMHVCRKITDVKDPRAFKSWLRTVSINTAREEGRKVTRRKGSMLKLVGMGGRSVQHTNVDSNRADDRIEGHDESSKVYRAAMSLPIGYREPILLRCLRSMSYQQISEVLDLPVTTIETRIARGRRMLKEILEHQSKQHTNTKSYSKVHQGRTKNTKQMGTTS